MYILSYLKFIQKENTVIKSLFFTIVILFFASQSISSEYKIFIPCDDIDYIQIMKVEEPVVAENGDAENVYFLAFSMSSRAAKSLHSEFIKNNGKYIDIYIGEKILFDDLESEITSEMPVSKMLSTKKYYMTYEEAFKDAKLFCEPKICPGYIIYPQQWPSGCK